MFVPVVAVVGTVSVRNAADFVGSRTKNIETPVHGLDLGAGSGAGEVEIIMPVMSFDHVALIIVSALDFEAPRCRIRRPLILQKLTHTIQ